MHIIPVHLFWNKNVESHQVQVPYLQVIKLNIRDSTNARVVVVVVKYIVEKLRTYKHACQHQSTVLTRLPVDVVRRDWEAGMLHRDAIYVDECHNETCFRALRVARYSDEIIGDGDGRHLVGLERNEQGLFVRIFWIFRISRTHVGSF